MKTLGLLAVTAALQALGQVQARGVRLVFNPMLDSGKISFLPQDDGLPRDLLLSNKTSDPDADKIKCTQDSDTTYASQNSVLLLFSSCVQDSTLRTVATWAHDMKQIVRDSVSEADELSLSFISTIVTGDCAAASHRALASANATSTNRSAILLEQDIPLKRLNAFKDLGDIQSLEYATETAGSLTAVISFSTDDVSYSEIVSFEGLVGIGNVINFQMGSGDNCEGRDGSCIELKTADDIFMYNPFMVTYSLGCETLENGVPVTLVGSNNKRQCFCGCPAGYAMKKTGNKQVCVNVDSMSSNCVWSKVTGYQHLVRSKSSMCSFNHIVDNWGIPMPLPTSSVSTKRLLLLADTTSLDPRVSMSVVRVQDPEYYAGYLIAALGSSTSSWPLKFKDVVARAPSAASLITMVSGAPDLPIHDQARTWKDYQSNRTDAVNSIVFSDYGKYRLEMNAFDYYSSAKCDGCLVILDSYRPQATTKCPASFCDPIVPATDKTCGKAELTMANVVKADSLIKQYFDFGDQAVNDGCSDNNRCDLHQFSKQNFFESKYTRYSHDDGISCFDPEVVFIDLLNNVKAKMNPLKRSDSGCQDIQNPVPLDQCSRCCKMTTALREFWTDYRCGSDYGARYCEGDTDQTCTFEQCLVMKGDTLATVTARLAPNVVAESEKVIKLLPQGSYQNMTQVHRALECTSFYGNDGECKYKAKLSELVNTIQVLNFAGDFNANDYIYWRFKVNGDSQKWHLWKTKRQPNGSYDDDEMLTFTDPETKISIEAWTQCGLVRSFFFSVQLHVNSPVDVCTQFSNMWYQTSVSRLPIAAQMCAYPGSDFAELTFDFHPTAGLQYSRTTLPLKVSEVVCAGAVETRSAVEILRVTKDSPEIVNRFAVEMLRTPNTEALTTFNVSCDFKYVDYRGSKRIKSCGHSFSISDCKGPQFDPPHAKCEYDGCAGSNKTGLYEACGGTIIKSSNTKTYLEQGNKECCQGCKDASVVCTALFSVPDTNANLMRCEPQTVTEAYHYFFPMSLLAQATQDHPITIMVFSCGVLAVAMMLIFVPGRVAASREAVSVPDSYYPLLYAVPA